MAVEDTDGSARDTAATQGAVALQEAQQRAAESLYYLDVLGDRNPSRAIIGSEIADNSPIPEVSASIMLYARLIRPYMLRHGNAARDWWTGDHFESEDRYDEDYLAAVEVPERPGVDGPVSQTTTEKIWGFKDLRGWSQKSIEIVDNRGRREVRCYLSPEAMDRVFDALMEFQELLGFSARPAEQTDPFRDDSEHII